MASEGKDLEVDEDASMDTSEPHIPDSDMESVDQHHTESMMDDNDPKFEADLDMRVHSPADPDDGPASPSCDINEDCLLDSSASSRASSDRGTPNKHGMRTPSGGGLGGGAGMADNMSTCSTGSSSSQTPVQGHVRGKCPNRPGIIWRKGEKVEAMDFMKKWYSAKIVDIDEDEGTVLIHFEGWNQRYDEWVEMTSDKLRPKMRHSGRKEKKKRLSGEYKLGELVYARWTDCKMYPGKVTNVQTDGSYEVMFYDGFKKTVQPMNIRPRSVDSKQKAEIGNVLPKEQRRKSNDEEVLGSVPGCVPLSDGAEIEDIVGRRRSCHLRSKVNPDAAITEQKSQQKDGAIQKPRKRPSVEVSKRKRRETTDGQPPKRNKETGMIRKRSASTTVSKKKLIVAGSFFARRERSDSDSVSVKSSFTGAGSLYTGETADRSRTPLKVDVRPQTPADKPVTPSLDGQEPVPTSTATVAPAQTVSVTPKQPLPQKPDPVPGVGVEVASGPAVVAKREKKARRRTASPSISEASSTSESQTELIEGTQARKRSRSKEKEKEKAAPLSQLSPSATVTSQTQTQVAAPIITGVPKKAFIIEQDHNHFKCVFEGCNKAFRKENLLDSHIKYYHCDDTKKHTVPQPTRKRRKTTSICSTDSDVSCSSKQTTPVSKGLQLDVGATTLTPDVPDCVTVDIVEEDMDIKTADLKHQRTCSQDTTATEDSIETEDELSKDEVVNCICLFNEENGLMIQCDVCLCWQHAVCFDLTVETLPKKYICFVCSDPTGVRESCRYIHEQDWIKHGNLTKFGFLNYQDRDVRKAGTIQATCGLVADVNNINTVLHSLKEEIKLSKDPEHPQLKMWITDLDSEELCPDDSGHESFNQSNQVTDNSIDQSDTVLHSKMDKSESNTESQTLQKDQSQSGLHREIHSSANTTSPAEQNGEEDVVVKSEPEEIPSTDSAGTVNGGDSSASVVSGTDTSTVDTKTEATGSPTTVTPSLSQSTVATVTQTTVSQSSESQSTKNPSTLNQSTKQESTSSQSTITQNTVSQSTQNTVSQSTHNTVSQSTQNTVSQSTQNTASQSSASESTETPKASQSIENKAPDRKPESECQTVKVKEEVVEEDPFQQCQNNLLQHILRVQGQIDSRLDMLEEQVTALEASETGKGENSSIQPVQNSFMDILTLKKSLHMLQSDLVKVKRMSAYHR
ncbi:PHD finger protein 20-like protein 1 isoform X2 [Argopecten irradians]|uniref:PHD finger protein 20-like protein 1 isoform X2 n=1 Tax=Argopecten irradians TaxID=31199 RepID=UPI003719E1F0